MDRDQRSRRQKNQVPPHQAHAPRSVQDRVGLERSTAPAPAPRSKKKKKKQQNNTRSAAQRPPQNTKTAKGQPNSRNQTPGRSTGQPSGAGNNRSRQQAGTRRGRTQHPQQNPQKPGYRGNAPGTQRRVTRAEQIRRRRRKAIAGALCVAGVLALGVVLSINLLFKVTDFRIETPERTTPADTGIYTEQQIIDTVGVNVGDNLLGFSTKEKSAQLLSALPYLDVARVDVQLPGTVVIKVRPAAEQFKLLYNGSWLVLSGQLKVLRVENAEPSGLVLLEANLAQGQSTAPGAYLTLEYAGQTAAEASEPGMATPEQAQQDTQSNDVLHELLDELEKHGLLEGTTVITMTDMDEISVLYEGRVSVRLGTANNLDYKVRFAAAIILDTRGSGLTSSDRGTLDVSNQKDDGSTEAVFTPAEEPTPTPEPSAEPEPDTQEPAE